MSSVWVQLYYKGEAKSVGEADPIEIEPIPKNVNALKMKVKAEKPTKLNHVDAGDLVVYASGTDVPVGDGPKGLSALAANVSGSEAATGTSYKRTLIVIAPKPEQQNGKLCCCFSILVVVFKFAILDIALANTWPNPLRQSDIFSVTRQNHSLVVGLEGAFPQLVDREC
jgi:hypothetical protein